MRQGVIQELVESYKVETGGNEALAGKKAAERLEGLFESGKLKVEDISIKQLFEELIDPNAKLDMHSSVEEIAEAVSTSNFATISNTVMNAAIIPAYESEVGDAAQLVTELPAVKTGPEEIGGYTAGGGFEQRPEHLSYAEETLGEKYWTIDKSDFGKIISLTRESIFDDRTGQLIRRAQGIGEKGGQLRAKIITQSLEVAARTAMGESASRAAVYMGTAISASNFYNADHSALIDSAGTNANLVASNPLGTSGNLQKAAAKLVAMVDEEGDEVITKADSLIFHTDLSETAWELIYGRVKRGDNNDIENFNYKRYRPIELPFLSSGTTWYLGAPKKQMVWLWVWKPETKVQTQNSNLAFQSQIVLRYRFNWYGGVGHTDYRHIIKNTA